MVVSLFIVDSSIVLVAAFLGAAFAASRHSAIVVLSLGLVVANVVFVMLIGLARKLAISEEKLARMNTVSKIVALAALAGPAAGAAAYYLEPRIIDVWAIAAAALAAAHTATAYHAVWGGKTDSGRR